MNVLLHCGDCLEVLGTFEPDIFDSCVTDPPYHFTSIVKRFGADDSAPAKDGKTGAYKRASAGFMGKQWDGGDIAFRPETWAAVYRVLKPGAHLVAFGAPKNFHRLACAIEDAGFEIRDTLAWLFGSGFPKSHDVSKAIDRAAGAEREKIRIDASRLKNPPNLVGGAGKGDDRPWRQNAIAMGFHEVDGDLPSTDAARQWSGWGTALKPAYEPIILARKPLSEPTIAANVLRWGTGGINVDGCRVPTSDGYTENCVTQGINTAQTSSYEPRRECRTFAPAAEGRFPANVVHDGSEEVVGMFPQSKAAYINQDSADAKLSERKPTTKRGITSFDDGKPCSSLYVDSGSAARFFYTAKADSDDRLGSKHPTVKPLDLMQWLVRLVTPKGGRVLDPFAGTGTTGEAAWREGMRADVIEREVEYQADIRRRIKLCLAGPDERARESIKARTADKPIDAGPLFGGT